MIYKNERKPGAVLSKNEHYQEGKLILFFLYPWYNNKFTY